MTMSALQQILAGKKPQPASPPSSLAAATPAAAPAASVSPPTTPAPAPAAAPLLAPSSPAPGPNAASVATPQGAPQDTLAAVLGAFVANAGKMPQVNPPEAPKVLAGPTALEVAGHPEPEEVKEPAPAPVEKPADVLAAEQAKKARRTAAVVQAELDAALKRIGELEAAIDQATSLVPQAAGAAQSEPEIATAADAALAEAVELIQSLQAEAVVATEDNAKAWARVAELETELETSLAQNAANVEIFSEKLAKQNAGAASAQQMTLDQAICLIRDLLPTAACEIKIAAHGYFKA